MKLLFAIIFCLSSLSMAGALTAQDEDPARAVLSARAYASIEPGSALRLKYLEDTELNLALRDEIESLLRDAGFVVADDAPNVLAFESAIVPEMAVTSGVEIGGLGGSRRSEHFQIRLTLPPRKTIASADAQRYRLKMSLAKVGSRPFWVGLAAAQKSQDRLRTVQGLARELIANLGQTVKSRSFRIE